jgi:2-polyprenyl-6-methoxyphenol hydroxylase-like FAD-dependent oxidoreductase
LEDVIVGGGGPIGLITALGLAQVAEIALRRLAGYSHATVRFDTRLIRLSQDVDGVTVHAMTPHGREEMRAKWLIGGDGAASTVRHQLDLNFEGMTWPERFIATNVFFDFDRHGYARGTFQVDQDHGANGGRERLEEALVTLRRLPTDRDFLLQRLMFLKSLERPPLLDAAC